MMIKKKITSQRGSTYYWANECQSDITIVFCHGMTADHHLFDKQVEALESKYRLIVWDYPLHGESRPYENFSYSNVNKELIEILKEEAIESIVLVGQSAGGYIAQSFIGEYPDMVKGFIGIGSTPFGKNYYTKSEMFWIKHFTAMAKLFPYGYYCKVSAKAVTVTEEARLSMYTTLVVLGRDGMLRASKAVYDEFLRSEEEVTYKCPVLLTYGELDKTGYVQRYNQDWAKKTGFPLKVIPNASHNANYDHHEVFNEILLEFIDKEVDK